MTRRSGRPTLAVVGATGAVGTVMRDLLSTRKNVWGDIRLDCIASVSRTHAVGARRGRRGRRPLRGLLRRRRRCDVRRAGRGLRAWAPIAAARGAVVVDNSSAFRMDDDVPLVVPEVNADAARNRPRGIIANPNCTTLSMIVVAGALHREYGLRGLVVSSYQAASGVGQAGIDALRDQLAKVASDRSLGTRSGDLRGTSGTSARFLRHSRSTSCRGPGRSRTMAGAPRS